eukprot:scaffold5835_cov58-Phaeocystis_antarctica.AAC.3
MPADLLTHLLTHLVPAYSLTHSLTYLLTGGAHPARAAPPVHLLLPRHVHAAGPAGHRPRVPPRRLAVQPAARDTRRRRRRRLRLSRRLAHAARPGAALAAVARGGAGGRVPAPEPGHPPRHQVGQRAARRAPARQGDRLRHLDALRARPHGRDGHLPLHGARGHRAPAVRLPVRRLLVRDAPLGDRAPAGALPLAERAAGRLRRRHGAEAPPARPQRRPGRLRPRDHGVLALVR